MIERRSLRQISAEIVYANIVADALRNSEISEYEININLCRCLMRSHGNNNNNLVYGKILNYTANK